MKDILLQEGQKLHAKMCEINDYIYSNPELGNEEFKSSARNQIKGTVINIKESGPIITVDTEVEGVKFKGILTRNSYESLNIKKGNDIYLIFKSINVNILDSYNAFNLHTD